MKRSDLIMKPWAPLLLLLMILTSAQRVEGVDESRAYAVKEVNGFLKALDEKSGSSPRPLYHCWTSSSTYTQTSFNVNYAMFSALCDNDPGFYQYCGSADVAEMAEHDIQGYELEQALCGFYICSYEDFMSGEKHESGLFTLMTFYCNPNRTCTNEGAKSCEDWSSWFHCTTSNMGVPSSSRCDGVIDCFWSEDEVGCDHQFGVECNSSSSMMAGEMVWRDPYDICGTESECVDAVDKVGSTICANSEKVGSCPRPGDGVERPIFRSQTCGPYTTNRGLGICIDGTDKINCTNRDVVFSCEHYKTGYAITLTDVVLCVNLTLCKDDINNKCQKPETNCEIHRHFICDGSPDCDNGLDEQNCDDLRSEMKCVRMVRNQTQEAEDLFILKDWVMDGVRDCDNGIDEDASSWKVCEYKMDDNERVSHYTFKNSTYPCNATFICNPNSEPVILLNLNKMCDGRLKDDCPVESSLCKISRDKNVNIKVFSNGPVQKYLSPCLPGVISNGYSSPKNCSSYILEDSHGTIPIQISGPAAPTLNCRDTFGETYVYLACLNLCKDNNITCPLRDIDYKKSCPNLPNRVLTLTKQGKLTFVTPHPRQNGAFINREMFACKNGRCLEYSQVCDLIDDCGDNSDEENCHNHFSCDESKTELIKRSQVCDGTIDCSNESDECSPDCPKQNNKRILTSTVLQVFGWLIGIPATLMNGFMILRNSRSIVQNEHNTQVSLSIAALVTIIALGDFFVGLYLLCIGIENVMRREDFCKKEMEWLTSSSCEFYGVISTFGSELTVFAMTFLSVYRAYVMRELKTSRRPHKAFIIKLTSACALMIVVAFLIAIIPTQPNLLEAYFYNGYYIENAPLFLGSKRNDKFVPLLEEYFRAENVTDISASGIRNMVQKMFRDSDDPRGEKLKFNMLGFYGSSGSCTFKFFVDPSDPQRHYTWFILVVNLLSLLVITGGYSSVHLFTQNSANKVGLKNTFGPLQRKITFIIFTDFLCWLPFIIVCFIHYMKYIDATSLYPIFSTIVLPINSVVNPLLYDSLLSSVPSKVWESKKRFTRIMLSHWRRWSVQSQQDFIARVELKVTNNLNLDQFECRNIPTSQGNVSNVTAC